MIGKRSVVVVLLSLFVASTSQAQCNELLDTAIGGDSITNAYWVEFLDVSPLEWNVYKVALGGLKAQQFNGETPNKDGVIIDYTQDLIDIGPASVVLLLGTNDSLVDWTNDDHSADFAVYTDSMGSILDRLDEAGIAVILGIPTPMQNIDPAGAKKAAGEARLDTLYRPWLWDEAEFRGLLIVDFFDVFVSYLGWEDLFADGVHPFTDEGGYLMAEAATDAICIQYVPEPSLNLSVPFGVVALIIVSRLKRN